jgi:hypothetical protein
MTSDDAFMRVPDQWSPDEAIERQLAAAADSPVPPSLRPGVMHAVSRQLRQTRAEGVWLFAAWLLVAALAWMQLSSLLAQTATSPRQVVVREEPAAADESPGERAWRAWSRFVLPLD